MVKLVFRSNELKEFKVAILDVSVWKLIFQFSAYIKFIGKKYLSNYKNLNEILSWSTIFVTH